VPNCPNKGRKALLRPREDLSLSVRCGVDRVVGTLTFVDPCEEEVDYVRSWIIVEEGSSTKISTR
jgi:hypothetical protein